MVLRYVLGRMDSPAVQAERFKMLASGTQLVAIGIVVASIVGPLFNPLVKPGTLAKVGGGIAAAFIELLAWHLMGYAVRIGVPAGESGDEGEG